MVTVDHHAPTDHVDIILHLDFPQLWKHPPGVEMAIEFELRAIKQLALKWAQQWKDTHDLLDKTI